MAINQRYLTIANGHMILTGNSLMIYQENVANGGPFISTDNNLQVPGYPTGTTLNWQQNSSMAVLDLPPNSTVLHAELTWTSLLRAGDFDYSAFVNTPPNFTTPASPAPVPVEPQFVDTTLDIATRSADVTALVQSGGSGEYTLGGIAGLNGIESTGISGNAAGWYLSIVVHIPDESSKLFQINVGNIFVPGQSNIDFNISGFSTPTTGPVTGRLFAGIQRGDPVVDDITIFTGPTAGTLNYQLSRPPMPDNNMIAGFISNTETGAIIDTSGTFGNNNNIPGDPAIAQPFARWHIDIAAFDISPSLQNNQTSLVTRSISNAQISVFDYNVYNVQIEAQSADVTLTKSVDMVYASSGDIITYTITAENSGTIQADNVVIQDVVPTGTTFVPGSVTGATGTPPELTLLNPIPAGESATVTFQVQVGDTIPTPNPVVNNASAEFTFVPLPDNPPISSNASSNDVSTQINQAVIAVDKAADSSFVGLEDILTYTLTLQNTGNVPASNIVLTDILPNGTTFIAGSVTGATGTPAALTLANPIPIGGSAVVTFQVLTDAALPNPNPLLNSASATFNYTVDPAQPDGGTGTSDSNTAETQVNSAIISTIKTADKSFANVGDTITYTITVSNSGNVPANNVVLTDALPTGVSFIAGSLTGASGMPPTLTLNAPVLPGSEVAVSYQVLVGANVPNPNPLVNSASAAFTYTVNPAQPDGATGISSSNAVDTLISTAKLVIQKSVDKSLSYIGDEITYQIAITNTGNTPANNVILTDILNAGLAYVPGSLNANVPTSGDPTTTVSLINPIAPGQTAAISFKATVTAIPNPNPAINVASAVYTYTVDPQLPNGASGTGQSNTVNTVVLRNNYGQQISDLIESVALEQAALSAIAQAEGAKIQRMAATPDVTPQQLLCLNKSVTDLMNSLALLEAVLKQKLDIVDCQIEGGTC